MKTTLIILGIAASLAACSPSKDKAAQESLAHYKHFVDSIYTLNESYKLGTDTDFVEVPLDPSDPSILGIDTIITGPSPQKSMSNQPYFWTPIQNAYTPIQQEVEANLTKMDEAMKKEYEAAKAKFEAMSK
jgi:hypothetical protein